jgi:membrane fusion protein (multidrug efflux system)
MVISQKCKLILPLLLASALISSCGKQEDPKDDKVQPVNIRVDVIRSAKLVDEIQVVGTIKALEDASISPEEGGVVKEIIIKKGRGVRKGDLILVLKDELLKASLDAAEAAYNTAQLTLDMQTKVYQEKGISELAYKNMTYSRDAARAQYDIAKVRWERTQIKSPIDGTVDNIIPNVGEFVPPGVPIARVVNTNTVKIQAEIPELYSGAVLPGAAAIITIDALEGDTLRGKVGFIGSTVSSVNRTLLVEVVVQNTFRKLKPEMVAKVSILREAKKHAIMVKEYIVQLVDRDKRVVYVEKNGRAEERVVELGGQQGNEVEITKGLNIGDSLIVSGYQKLINGSPVVITE